MSEPGEITPDQIPYDAVDQLDAVVMGHAPSGDIRDDTARQVIADLVNKTLAKIREHGDTIECPECFALVKAERIKAHEYWHELKWPRGDA